MLVEPQGLSRYLGNAMLQGALTGAVLGGLSGFGPLAEFGVGLTTFGVGVHGLKGALPAAIEHPDWCNVARAVLSAAAIAGGAYLAARGAVGMVRAVRAGIVAEGVAGQQKPCADCDGESEHHKPRSVREQEKAIDDYLRRQGRDVQPNPEEGQHGSGRQGDRYVDGVLTECKTVKGSKPSAIVNRVREGLGRGDKGPQARDFVVNTTPSGISEDGARQALNEIVRKYGGTRLDSIEIFNEDLDYVLKWP